jgi:DNA-binding CsgD family transcriptional regulator
MVVGVLAGYVVARRVLARRARSVAALTDRQREVLRAAAGGLSTKEISELLGISAASVNTHIRRARRTPWRADPRGSGRAGHRSRRRGALEAEAQGLVV